MYILKLESEDFYFASNAMWKAESKHKFNGLCQSRLAHSEGSKTLVTKACNTVNGYMHFLHHNLLTLYSCCLHITYRNIKCKTASVLSYYK